MGASVETLTQRMDALAHALQAAGIDADRVATILGTAATATMNALLLDAVLEENAGLEAVPAPERAAVPAEQPLRVAA